MLKSRLNISILFAATVSVSVYLLAGYAQSPAQQQQSVLSGEAAQAQNEVRSDRRINKRPLLDFLARARDLYESGRLDLNQPVELLIEADIGANGALENITVAQTSGDPVLHDLAAEFMNALNESRVHGEIKGAKHLRFALKSHDGANLSASAAYDMESAQQAASHVSAARTFLHVAAQRKQRPDHEIVYRSLNATAHDNQIILSFSMPRETFCALLSKYLSSH